MAEMVKLYALQKVGNQNEDRLSALPDALLHHIFSFLDSADVVRTCVLSKKWTGFWSSFPFLNLSSENKADFVKFSESLLLRRDVGSDINTLSVRCGVDVASDVNSWIIIVSKLNIQVLDIHFVFSLVDHGEEHLLLVSFLHCIYNCVSLRVLKLKLPYNSFYYKLNMPNHVYLPCLEILYFKRIVFDDGCFSRLISSCSRLQSLTLYECTFVNDLISISCPHLETFIIHNSVDSFLSFEISAPCLTSLVITNWDPIIHSIRSISDFPYLLNVKIDAKFCSLASYRKVVIAVRNAQSLNISFDFILEDVLKNEPHADKWIPCPFDNLKHIKLETKFRTSEVLLIIKLLKASPNLETVVVCNRTMDGEDDSTGFYPGSSMFNLDRLTQVHFDEFYGMEDEMDLVRFFISNAENLKKLTLVPRDNPDCVAELAEVTRLLIKRSQRCNFSFTYNDGLYPSLIVTFI